MLSPDEFTVGSVGDAAPLSLMLPRSKYENPMLVGLLDRNPVAIFLAGQFAFTFFESAGNRNYDGIIIHDIKIEVDEATIFDPNDDGIPPGSIVRTDTRLTIFANRERPQRRPTEIELHSNLPTAGDLKAAFTKWQAVIGVGMSKKVLWHSQISKL